MNTTERSMLQNITPSQIKKIRALAKTIGIPDDVYHETLWISYEVKSTKDLLNFQANELINRMIEFGTRYGAFYNKCPDKYKALNGRPGFASGPQLALIESLWDKVSRMETPEAKAKALRGFLFRVAGVSDLRFLNKIGAGKVIVALRAMEKKQTEKRSGHGSNV